MGSHRGGDYQRCLGEIVDAIAILAIVVLNAVIGFYQEFSAEKSIAALRKMTAPHAKVRRDGSIHDVPASDVVPGDIIEFEAGDLIAADARLLDATSLKCVESALTGESEAVEKTSQTLKESNVPLPKPRVRECAGLFIPLARLADYYASNAKLTKMLGGARASQHATKHLHWIDRTARCVLSSVGVFNLRYAADIISPRSEIPTNFHSPRGEITCGLALGFGWLMVRPTESATKRR